WLVLGRRRFPSRAPDSRPTTLLTATPEHLLAARFSTGPRFCLPQAPRRDSLSGCPGKRSEPQAGIPPFTDASRPKLVQTRRHRVTPITTPCDLNHRSRARFPVSKTMALSQRPLFRRAIRTLK